MRRWLVIVATFALLLLGFQRIAERRPKSEVAPAAPTIPGVVVGAASPATGTQTVEGFVVDEKGHAIAGARACARRIGTGLADDERRASCVDTGDDGRFAFLAAEELEIVASARGRLPGKSVARRPEHPIEIVLANGGARITGSVLDPLLRPVAGARVTTDDAEATTLTDGTFELWTSPGVVTLEVNADGYADHAEQAIGPSERVGVTLEWGSTIVGRASPFATVSTNLEDVGERIVRADATGAFRIAGLRAGSYQVEARSPGKYGISNAISLGVSEVSSELAIGMEDAPDVLFTVAGCASGTATLHGRESGGSLVRSTLTAGVARITSVRPGHYEARVSCETASVLGSRFVTVGPEGASVAFEASPGFPVSGIVVDAKGRPLPFATVTASRKHEASSITLRADRDGKFRFVSLATGWYTLIGSHLDAIESGISVNVGSKPVEDVRIELEVGGTVSGRALDPDGKPVADLRIDAAGRVARTGLDGRFVLVHVQTGELTLEATRGARTLGTANVTVEEGKASSRDIVVDRENETLSGRVVDDQGAPIAEAVIELSREQGMLFLADPSLRTTTDGDGRFSIARLSHVAFTVRASRRGFGSDSTTGEPGTAVAITLAKASSLVASVELSTGGVAHGGYAWLTCGSHLHVSGAIATDGSLTFDDLGPGSCRLEVHAGSNVQKVSIELKSGEIARPVVRIEPWAFVEGRVIGGPNTILVANGDNATRTDLEGRFGLALRPGTWTISTADSIVVARDLVLTAGQTVVLPPLAPPN
ncbi:MAG: carboxypeptidase-like regulatory domain-containing protein [Polyangiales bacterium]